MLLVPDPMTIGRDEKGIRLKTGAVPAAVSSLNIFRPLLVTVPFHGMGRLRKIEQARRPASNIRNCFRAKSNCSEF
jgi:hypothetical protein